MAEGMSYSTKVVLCLFMWYSLAFVAGIVLLLKELLAPDFLDREVTLSLALLSSMGAALVSSSLFYSRKLYKDIFAFNQNMNSQTNQLAAVATFVYYVSRPFFSLLFAILVVLSGVTFVHATTAEGTKLSLGFVLFSVLLSAYGAAATGQVVQQIEKLAGEKLQRFGSTS
jgi:hypothetical protein